MKTLNQSFFRKLPWLVGERLFLSIIISFLICLLIGGFVFYQYNLQLKDIEPVAPVTIIAFEKDAFYELIEKWLERGVDFEMVKQKEYPNLFK